MLPCGPADTKEWNYRSNVEIADDIILNNRVKATQDNHVARDRLKADYNYQVATYTDASFLSNGATHVSVYDSAGYYQHEFSQTRHIGWHAKRRKLKIDTHIQGRTACLYGIAEQEAENYAHWMIDCLARVFLLQRFHELEQFDHFLVPRLKHDFQRQSLIALGVPEHKLLEVSPLQCLSFDELVCTSAPRGFHSMICPGWIVDEFRGTFLNCMQTPDLPDSGSGKTYGKRIYISRKDAHSRRFASEGHIGSHLESLGFQSVVLSELGLKEKIALFSNAEFIVSLSGAGLANLMFCPVGENTQVLELMPSSQVHYLFSSISGWLGHKHEHLIFSNNSLASKFYGWYGELELSRAQLDEALAQLGASGMREQVSSRWQNAA